MKKIFTFVITIAVVLCMTACTVPKSGSVSRENRLSDAFSASVSIVLDRLEAVGELKRYGEGVWEIEFSEPNTLSGVKLEFSEGSVIASYKGLTFSVPQSAVPVKAMMLNLMKAVDDNAKADELSGEEDGGILKINGTLDGGDYSLSVDKEGHISSFEMPNNKLTMRFTEVKTAEISIEQGTAETSIALSQVTADVSSTYGTSVTTETTADTVSQ